MKDTKATVATDEVVATTTTKTVVKKAGSKKTANAGALLKEDLHTLLSDVLVGSDLAVEVIDGESMFSGMTAQTLVVRGVDADVQIKLITPTAKNNFRYKAE